MKPSRGLKDLSLLTTAELIVIFATHNGENWIEEVLDAYSSQKDAEFPWALLVVNNNSSDDTRRILAKYVERIPLINLFEPKPGKNVALNRAISAATISNCDYVFSDDDAIPSQKFISNWRDILRTKLDYELFAGEVIPDFRLVDANFPLKFEQWHDELYARNIRPEGEIDASSIYGPNMAVRQTVFNEGFRFNEGIGPSSVISSYPMGSETEFCTRVAKSMSAKAFFPHGPSVKHIVRENQTTESFILGRAFRHGCGYALMNPQTGPSIFKSALLTGKEWAFAILGAFGSSRGKWNAAWLKGYNSNRIS